MNILTREYLESLYPNHTKTLWIPESTTSAPLEYFICVKPIRVSGEFWIWCDKYLKGECRCMSSNNLDEIWGFTNKTDINWFILRWG